MYPNKPDKSIVSLSPEQSSAHSIAGESKNEDEISRQVSVFRSSSIERIIAIQIAVIDRELKDRVAAKANLVSKD